MKTSKILYIMLSCLFALGFASCYDYNPGLSPNPDLPPDSNTHWPTELIPQGPDGEDSPIYVCTLIDTINGATGLYHTLSTMDYDIDARIKSINYPNKEIPEYTDFEYHPDDNPLKVIGHRTQKGDETYTAQYTLDKNRVEIKYSRATGDYLEVLTIDNAERLTEHVIYLNNKIESSVKIEYDDSKLIATISNNLDPLQYKTVRYELKRGYESDTRASQWFLALRGNYYPQYNEVERILYENGEAKFKFVSAAQYTPFRSGLTYPYEIKQTKYDMQTNKLLETIVYGICYDELKV